jgi:hypothetical protein
VAATSSPATAFQRAVWDEEAAKVRDGAGLLAPAALRAVRSTLESLCEDPDAHVAGSARALLEALDPAGQQPPPPPAERTRAGAVAIAGRLAY